MFVKLIFLCIYFYIRKVFNKVSIFKISIYCDVLFCLMFKFVFYYNDVLIYSRYIGRI